MLDRAGLKVAEVLADFIEREALPGTGITPDHFWAGCAEYLHEFTQENEALLAKRAELEAAIDAWHRERRGQPHDGAAYQAFLTSIGYLLPPVDAKPITTEGVDAEIARIAGPQLVVPVMNGRYALNAANARWGSLYDAFYGTDVIPGPRAPGYDPARGALVIKRARAFLNETLPLTTGTFHDARAFKIFDGALVITLADGTVASLRDPSALVGFNGPSDQPGRLVFRHHGLHIILVIDGNHPVGRDDPAHIADVVLESALTTIQDFEDSIAAVDAEDKVLAYRNWLGLMKGDLTESFEKGGQTLTRRLAEDLTFTAPNGGSLTLPGRSLMLVRNVGHLMRTDAVILPDGAEAFEGMLDGLITSLIALHDLRGARRNSKTGSVYIVKPKMHGPAEVDFAVRCFGCIEEILGLPARSLKIGIMDEERRTSLNLDHAINAAADRVVFINTGFLDRTGDEIHTSMEAGAMIPKGAMKTAPWISAYEARNVDVGLAAGFSGRAQIGKGMWAMPDLMADMLAAKIAHPKAAASTAWVPSPTAATLHALHYHAVEVAAVQTEAMTRVKTPREALLNLPLATGHNWTAAEIQAELDNNIQGILGYVVRWVGQGIGCSKVPDINGVGLMEDRATLRISSQHVANWLYHGICDATMVNASFERMAAKVDAQNAQDPAYAPMGVTPTGHPAFEAARALVFQGRQQPNGYTEPLLHAWRRKVKADA